MDGTGFADDLSGDGDGSTSTAPVASLARALGFAPPIKPKARARASSARPAPATSADDESREADEGDTLYDEPGTANGKPWDLSTTWMCYCCGRLYFGKTRTSFYYHSLKARTQRMTKWSVPACGDARPSHVLFDANVMQLLESHDYAGARAATFELWRAQFPDRYDTLVKTQQQTAIVKSVSPSAAAPTVVAPPARALPALRRSVTPTVASRAVSPAASASLPAESWASRAKQLKKNVTASATLRIPAQQPQHGKTPVQADALLCACGVAVLNSSDARDNHFANASSALCAEFKWYRLPSEMQVPGISAAVGTVTGAEAREFRTFLWLFHHARSISERARDRVIVSSDADADADADSSVVRSSTTTSLSSSSSRVLRPRRPSSTGVTCDSDAEVKAPVLVRKRQ